MVKDSGGDTTRCSNITIIGEYLPALRPRPMGKLVAAVTFVSFLGALFLVALHNVSYRLTTSGHFSRWTLWLTEVEAVLEEQVERVYYVEIDYVNYRPFCYGIITAVIKGKPI